MTFIRKTCEYGHNKGWNMMQKEKVTTFHQARFQITQDLFYGQRDKNAKVISFLHE